MSSLTYGDRAALARIRDPSAVDALLRELESDPVPALRARIALALAAIEAPSAYDALVEMLRDPLPAVQFYALRGLRELGRPEAAGDVSDFYRRTAERLADRSSDDLVADARAVLAALGLHVEALRTLLALDPDAGVDAFLDSARAADIPRDSQTALRIAEGFYERQRIALHGLGYCHSPDAGRLLAGADGIGHPDPRLRAVAVRSLAVHGGPEVAAALIPMLRDPVPEVRWTAANALGRVADSAAMSPLVVRLQDEYGEVRRQAALSLGYLWGGDRTRGVARARERRPGDGSARGRRLRRQSAERAGRKRAEVNGGTMPRRATDWRCRARPLRQRSSG